MPFTKVTAFFTFLCRKYLKYNFIPPIKKLRSNYIRCKQFRSKHPWKIKSRNTAYLNDYSFNKISLYSQKKCRYEPLLHYLVLGLHDLQSWPLLVGLGTVTSSYIPLQRLWSNWINCKLLGQLDISYGICERKNFIGLLWKYGIRT